jgi:hypothetical protein
MSSDRPLMHEAAVGGVIAAQRALQHLGLEKASRAPA